MYVINYLCEEIKGEYVDGGTICYSADKDSLQEYLEELFEEIKVKAKEYNGKAIIIVDDEFYKEVQNGRDCDDLCYVLSIDKVKPLEGVRGI